MNMYNNNKILGSLSLVVTTNGHYYKANVFRTNITAALIIPAIGNVTSHDSEILRKTVQCTTGCAWTSPTATTLPTLHCVELIGNPNLLANSTVTAAPNSMAKPPGGVILVKFSPTV